MSGTAKFDLSVRVSPDPDDGGFVAQVVEYPGVMSQGETEREAVDNALEAFFCVVSATLDLDADHAVSGDAGESHTHRLSIAAIV